MQSTTMEVTEITNDMHSIGLPYDYNKKLTRRFFARVEWKQAHAIRRRQIIVESQL